jgi:hypothetical protein
MRVCNSKNVPVFLASAAIALIAGCAGTGAPDAWLPDARTGGQEAYGAWIIVELEAGGLQQPIAGEFLALGPDSLFVLTAARLEAIPLADVHRAKVIFYDPRADVVGIWTAVGTLSTPSHGVGLLISAPVWLLLGCSTTVVQRNNAIRNYPRSNGYMQPAEKWSGMNRFARFPQGPPPDIRELPRPAKEIPPMKTSSQHPWDQPR